MSVNAGYERLIYSHIYCYMSLYGVSLPIQVTGCWLSPLGCNRQSFSIQEGWQYCWCMLLLNWSGHVYIVHQKYILCLTDIFHWWKRCMMNDCREGTNFYQHHLMLQQPVWYLPHTLFWNCVCSVRIFLGIYLSWDPYARLPVMRSDITWAQEMGDYPILQWGCPSW